MLRCRWVFAVVPDGAVVAFPGMDYLTVLDHRPRLWGRGGGRGRIGRISQELTLGWDRTRLDGTQGARIWTGYGVLAHNLVKIGALAD
jgi:hypothetical protein